jgi:hypothetical protein
MELALVAHLSMLIWRGMSVYIDIYFENSEMSPCLIKLAFVRRSVLQVQTTILRRV